MLKKTLFFHNAYHLSIKYNQLIITDKNSREKTQRPVEDLGFVILDHQQITFTQSVIQHLAANNVAVVFCNKKHHPASMLFHLDTHQTQNEHFRAQVEASKPLKKQLWKQTVKAKIHNQAALLDFIGEEGDALRYMARQVKSGDTSNEEGRASRHYWDLLFYEDFHRRRHGPPPNNMLNYGYTILRAGVARALMGSGLLPTIGIHHHNKYDAYCLADDIMEPYRPYVDQHVLELYETGQYGDDLRPEIKVKLLEILSGDIFIGDKKRPMMVGVSETTASLARCFKGEQRKIKYPEL
ncbi:MAG TPA: type II CRISPR-associated endonuclease Cas1 [Balneolaceae bacterium]|nr:type II CRISPR-associated endonuclease Cas1 [Balneolaceae bacterium]